MVSSRVALESVSWAEHGALLSDWVRRPHVARWWLGPDGWIDDMRATPDHSHALIGVAGTPVGYVRGETVDRDALAAAGLDDIPEGSIDIDLFIGDADWLGRGVGPAALNRLLERLAAQTNAPLAGLCTSVENTRALRAYEKAGFRRLRTYDDPDYGPCWVLVVELRPGPRRIGPDSGAGASSDPQALP